MDIREKADCKQSTYCFLQADDWLKNYFLVPSSNALSFSCNPVGLGASYYSSGTVKLLLI